MAEFKPVDVSAAQEFLTRHHCGVLATRRKDGGLQMSPITVGLDDKQRVIISIPAHEYYEGSNPFDEPMILLGNSHKATAEDVAKAGGQRNEIDDKTGKRIIYQHGGGRDQGVLAD